MKISGKQTVKLTSGSIKFKNHFQKLDVPFKIYDDFEFNLKVAQSNDRNDNTSYTEKYQNHISCSLVYKIVFIDDKFNKLIVLYRGKNVVYKFIQAILKE